MQNAFAYIRISGQGQAEGHGLTRQREAIEEHAKRAGYRIEQWFEDVHTGAEADRPGFVGMLASMNGVRTVIVESLDRFARDAMVQAVLLTKMLEGGLTLISASTGQDITADFTDDPMRRAMVQMAGVFAELDKSLLVKKLRKAREAMRAATGRCEGRKPLGAKLGEQEVIDRIKRMRRRRMGKVPSYAKIAKALNDEGVPTIRAASRWHETTVRKIIVGVKRKTG